MFKKSSPPTVSDLMTSIAEFAVSVGWKKDYWVEYSGDDGAMGLSKNTSFVSISNFITKSKSFKFAVSESFTPNKTLYYGHPNSSSPDQYYSSEGVNDIITPLKTTWMFSNSTGDYINIFILNAEGRMTYFCFGELDNLGSKTPAVTYATGIYYDVDSKDPMEDFFSSYHEHIFTGNNIDYYIPKNVLNTNYFNNIGPLSQRGAGQTKQVLVSGGRSYDRYLDIFRNYGNSSTTGGTPLLKIPVIYQEKNNENLSFLGFLNDLRMVNIDQFNIGDEIDGFNIGDEISYGKEIWVVFPVKQKGSSHKKEGRVNTQFYGLACKKNV